MLIFLFIFYFSLLFPYCFYVKYFFLEGGGMIDNTRSHLADVKNKTRQKKIE